MYSIFAAFIVMLLCMGLFSAWMMGCISRVALDAVRKKPFDFGHAMNPSGGFGSSIMMIGGGMLIMLIGYLPIIINVSTGLSRGWKP